MMMMIQCRHLRARASEQIYGHESSELLPYFVYTFVLSKVEEEDYIIYFRTFESTKVI